MTVTGTRPTQFAVESRGAVARGGDRIAVIGLLVAALLASTPVQAANRGSADVQWAQQVLKEKGFDVGRPNGDLDAKTRAALLAYQKSVGLPASGQLDPGTVGKLMQGRQPSTTMGNLAAHPAGHPGGTTGSGAGPRANPVPLAAPRGVVQAVAGAGTVAAIGSMGHGVASGVGAPGPQAAPRGAVAAQAAVPVPGTVAMAPDRPAELVVPAWVRALIGGIAGATILGFLAIWWRSGQRRPGLRPPVTRREPSLESFSDSVRAPSLRPWQVNRAR